VPALVAEKNHQLSTTAELFDDEFQECVFLSQDFLAAKFTEQHAPSWRYISDQGKWRQWDGMKWEADDKCAILTKARLICRAHAKSAETKAAQRAISSAPTVAAVVKLAGADPKHAATIDQWDANRMLLNTHGGIVNPATGKMFPHHPDLYMTRACCVAPCKMPTPEWDKFLKWAQPDAEVRDYLERRSGYGLTGDVSEQAFFMDYGHGGNGKGVYKNVISEIMSKYLTVAPIELLTETPNDQHPTELARLHCARAVSLSETQGGRRWNENRIKMMTGGDRITARFMRQDFFEYDPQFKLYILGNHMPTLRNVDEAMKRRFQLVHWAEQIARDKRDDKLIEKLRPEYPGILYKLIQACLDWQQGGLNPPSVVTKRTDEYFTGEDKLGQWVSEWDTSDPTAFTSKSELFNHWFDWCTKQGETPTSKIILGKKLKDRGYKDEKRSMRGNDVHGFWGIKPPTCSNQHCDCHH
jgi:P4 family phage/plasmid primase-like protien